MSLLISFLIDIVDTFVMVVFSFAWPCQTILDSCQAKRPKEVEVDDIKFLMLSVTLRCVVKQTFESSPGKNHALKKWHLSPYLTHVEVEFCWGQGSPSAVQ